MDGRRDKGVEQADRQLTYPTPQHRPERGSPPQEVALFFVYTRGEQHEHRLLPGLRHPGRDIPRPNLVCRDLLQLLLDLLHPMRKQADRVQLRSTTTPPQSQKTPQAPRLTKRPR